MFDIRKAKELNNKIIECRYDKEEEAYFWLVFRDGMIYSSHISAHEKFVASISDITGNKEWMSTMINHSDIDKWYKDFALRIMFYAKNSRTELGLFLDTLYTEYTGLKFSLGKCDKKGNIVEWVGCNSKMFNFDDWYS